MDSILKHHYENIANGTAVQNEDGSLSTVFTIIVEIDGEETLIPTVWDGQILDQEEAIQRAISSGVSWPKAPAGPEGVEALELQDAILHKEMKPVSSEEARQKLNETTETMDGFALGGLATARKGITTQEGLDMANKSNQRDDKKADVDGDGKLSPYEKERAEAVQNNELIEDEDMAMAHGGMACGIMGYDEKSGNEIPLGSSAENVRDDIDAKLSTDEFVLPAHVVKYHGLKHIMGLMEEANMGLMGMHDEGLLKGDEEESPEEEISSEEGKTECPVCEGTGEDGGEECTHCDGSGYHYEEEADEGNEIEVATIIVEDNLEETEEEIPSIPKNRVGGVKKRKYAYAH